MPSVEQSLQGGIAAATARRSILTGTHVPETPDEKTGPGVDLPDTESLGWARRPESRSADASAGVADTPQKVEKLLAVVVCAPF